MTRCRANPNNLAPTSSMVEYYRQRSSQGGLLITEAIHISAEATPIWTIYQRVQEQGGYVTGIWTEAQTSAWQTVVEAVHKAGGKISCQLLHTGRIAQPDIAEHPIVKGKNLPLPPVSASSIAIHASDEIGNDYNWDKHAVLPRALETSEIPRLVNDYRKAAENAKKAGFDIIELHAAHGYLIEQFLSDNSNQRRDNYGGTVVNRCRLLFEVIETLIDVVGAGNVGVRLSPISINQETGKQTQTYFDVIHSDPEMIYTYIVSALNQFPLAYLLLTEPRVGGLSADANSVTPPLANRKYRQLYQGNLIGAGGFTPESAAEAINGNAYDAIAFGRWFLANPDLPARIKAGAPLNPYHRATFYGGGDEGYIDYEFYI